MTTPHLCEHENWPGPGPQPSGRRPLALPAGPARLRLRLYHRRPHRPGRPRATPSRRLAHPRYLRPGNSQPLQRKPSAPTAPPTSTACAETTPVRHTRHHLPGKPEPGFTPRAGIEREVLMAAHEGSDHAEQAERRDIGDATLERLRADVVRLSAALMTAELSRSWRSPFGATEAPSLERSVEQNAEAFV
jgi:hypothetical protein